MTDAQRCGDFGGKSRQTKRPCRRFAGAGTDHVGHGQCKHHFGNGRTPQHKTAVDRRDETAIRDAAARFAIPRDHLNPADAMLEQLRAAAGTVDFYYAQIVALIGETEAGDEGVHPANVLIFGTTKHAVGKERGEKTNLTETGPGLHMWLRLWNEERDRLVRYAHIATQAGVEERRIRLAEAQGAIWGQALAAILRGLELTPMQMQKAPVLIRQHTPSLTA